MIEATLEIHGFISIAKKNTPNACLQFLDPIQEGNIGSYEGPLDKFRCTAGVIKFSLMPYLVIRQAYHRRRFFGCISAGVLGAMLRSRQVCAVFTVGSECIILSIYSHTGIFISL